MRRQRTVWPAFDRDGRREDRAAAFFGEIATIREGAAGRQVGKFRHGAGNGAQPRPLRRAEPRPRAEQALAVGMAEAGQQRLGLAVLHHGPAIHHHHALHVFGDDAEIMRNQDHRHAALGDEIGDQVEDLALDSDIERGGRLVRDQ